MAYTLSRIDRKARTYELSATVLAQAAAIPPDLTGVDVALLPPRAAPTAATVWYPAEYADGSFTVLLAGPDADSTGALVVPASADLWMKIADAPEVDAEKLERITVLGGGPNLPAAPLYVGSVNGQTGVVDLDADDVGAVGVGDGAGGALSGSYPNPGLNETAVENIVTASAAVKAAAGSVASTVTASGALVVQKHNPVDASGGAKTMTLPTGQVQGSTVSVEKTDSTKNLVSITGNLRGVAAQTITLSWSRETVGFRADSAGSWWPITGHKTKTSLEGALVPRGDSSLSGLLERPVKQEKLEAVAWPAPGVAQIVFEKAAGTAGEIRNVWFALRHTVLMFDSKIRVYVDQEATPSIDCDLGTFFLFHYSNVANVTTAGADAFHTHLHTQTFRFNTTDWYGMTQMKWPIPFGNGIRIEIYNSTATAVTNQRIYAQIAWVPLTTAPRYRLRASSQSLVGAPTTTPAQSIDLLNLTGKKGVVVALNYVGDSAVDYSYMERNINAYVDGEVTPSFQNSGTEDFFFGAWYFTNRKTYSSPSAMVMIANNAAFQVTMGVDLLDAFGGIPFTTGMKLRIETEAAGANNSVGSLTDFVLAYSALWYEDTSA